MAKQKPFRVFFGKTSPVAAHVYVELTHAGLAVDQMHIEGQIVGPECPYAKTLPASIPLEYLGTEPSSLAHALLPDPCGWTPKLPFRYQVEATLVGPDGPIVCTSEPLAIRRLAPAGNDLFLDGERICLRSVTVDEPSLSDLEVAHAEEFALWISSPSDTLIEAANKVGVFLIVDASSSNSVSLWETIERFVGAPSIACIVCDVDAAIDPVKKHAHNTLFAARVDDHWSGPFPGWADLIIWETHSRNGEAVPAIETPIPIIVRSLPPSLDHSLRDRRMRCDPLQSELAPTARFAGFSV